jgi:tetratricopeptide (TPR) repeat protein
MTTVVAADFQNLDLRVVGAEKIEQTAAPQSEPQPGRRIRIWRLTKVWSKLALARFTAISTGVMASWIIWLVGDATLHKHSLEILTIEVPKQLADNGFSPDVVTRRLRDGIRNLQTRATTTIAKDRVDVHEIADITIPKAGISVESVAASIRRLLPKDWQHVLSGEFTISETELTLRLRLNGEVVFSDASTTLGAVDGLLDKAAFQVVRRTQPFVAASWLFETGDLSGSIDIMDQIIDSLPPEDDNIRRAYNLKGLIADKQKEYTAAEAFFLEYPNYALARNSLGALRDHQHRPDEAIREYRLAAHLDPTLGLPHSNLGRHLSEQGKDDEASWEYRRAIQLDPKAAFPHAGLGEVLVRQGKNEEAIAEYRQAIRLDPNYARPHIELANVFARQGKDEETNRERQRAIHAYRLAIEADPKDASPHAGLGYILSEEGKNEEAIAEYRLAIEADPKDASPHAGLGYILTEEGKNEEAIAEYRQAIRLDPKWDLPHRNLGWVLTKLGKNNKAMNEYKLATQLEPKAPVSDDLLSAEVPCQNLLFCDEIGPWTWLGFLVPDC